MATTLSVFTLDATVVINYAKIKNLLYLRKVREETKFLIEPYVCMVKKKL